MRYYNNPTKNVRNSIRNMAKRTISQHFFCRQKKDRTCMLCTDSRATPMKLLMISPQPFLSMRSVPFFVVGALAGFQISDLAKVQITLDVRLSIPSLDLIFPSNILKLFCIPWRWISIARSIRITTTSWSMYTAPLPLLGCRWFRY